MQTVEQCEELLRDAMMRSDVEQLDALLADDLIFINHFGQPMGKADDLEAHRKKLFTLTGLKFQNQEIRHYGNVAVTITLASLGGIWNKPFSDTITYFRVWRRGEDGTWRLEAGQATKVA